MCEATVRHDQSDHTVVEQVMHNLSTAIDELEVILATRKLSGPVIDGLQAARDNLEGPRSELLEALSRLPRRDESTIHAQGPGL